MFNTKQKSLEARWMLETNNEIKYEMILHKISNEVA